MKLLAAGVLDAANELRGETMNQPRLRLASVLALTMVAACAQDVDKLADQGEAEELHPLNTSADTSKRHCEDDGDEDTDTLEAQLARARAATEKYRDVNTAHADGFTASGACVSHPELGTMGFHYVNFDRLMDPLAIEEPEALVYIIEDGKHRLVAIEYLLPILVDGMPYLGCGVENNTCPPETPGATPSLFTGVLFDGPMAGHQEGMPWHFDQHVWLYEHNPSGMFAPYNPDLECPGEDC
jgi:hypothetical protein